MGASKRYRPGPVTSAVVLSGDELLEELADRLQLRGLFPDKKTARDLIDAFLDGISPGLTDVIFVRVELNEGGVQRLRSFADELDGAIAGDPVDRWMLGMKGVRLGSPEATAEEDVCPEHKTPLQRGRCGRCLAGIPVE